MAEGDVVRTIVKFLSNELSKEREEAVSLLYELSKSETLCEKIGSINGAILILVGHTESEKCKKEHNSSKNNKSQSPTKQNRWSSAKRHFKKLKQYFNFN